MSAFLLVGMAGQPMRSPVALTRLTQAHTRGAQVHSLPALQAPLSDLSVAFCPLQHVHGLCGSSTPFTSDSKWGFPGQLSVSGEWGAVEVSLSSPLPLLRMLALCAPSSRSCSAPPRSLPCSEEPKACSCPRPRVADFRLRLQLRLMSYSLLLWLPPRQRVYRF